MNRPPYPARVVAGLLVTTLEETRKLPTRALTLPMTAVSSVLQAGMRLQQNVAELAIKGDEVLAPLFDKPEEQPEWARFDEDDEPEAPSTPQPVAAAAPPANPEAPKPNTTGLDTAGPNAAGLNATGPDATGPDPASGRFALYSTPPAAVPAASSTTEPKKATAPTGPAPDVVTELGYDGLTLAQLRAKIRTLDLSALTDLAAYERANRNRAPFVTMIDNRVASQQRKADAGQ